MSTPTTIKQALDQLTSSIQPVITTQGGTNLVTTETTTPSTPTQATPATQKQPV